MAEKCPICHRDKGVFTDDPLKTPNHPVTELRGATPIRARNITELQVEINSVEASYGLPRTSWTTVDPVTFVGRGQYVNELREAIEAILTHIGIDLVDWLSWNADNEPTEGITSWLDGSRLDPDRLARGMHIEQLRKQVTALDKNVIFGESGILNKTYFFSGIANKSTTKPYFRKFANISNVYPSPINYWACIFNNVYSQMIVQNNVFHLFQAFDGNHGFSFPTYSYNTTKNLDIGNWQGFIAARILAGSNWTNIKAAYRNNCAKFDPPIPIYPYNEYGDLEADFYYYEGVKSMAIDVNAGQDYYMYTAELVLQRYLLGVPADYDWAETLRMPIPNYIAKYVYPKERILGTSNGDPNQTFNAGTQGIKLPIYNTSELIYVGDEIWTKVDELDDSGPQDKNYTIDNASGIVTFGNGVQGKIPPNGSQIKIFITLLGGGTWLFVKILLPRDVPNLTYYHDVQVKENKLFYNKSSPAIEVGRARINGITASLSNGYHQIWNQHGADINETWTFDYLLRGDNGCNHELLVNGNFAIEPNPYWSGTLDKAILAPTFGYSGYIRPNVVSDNPEAFSMKFDNRNCAVVSLDCRFVSNLKNAWGLNSYVQFPVAVYENVTYGYWTYVAPPPPGGTWTWHDNKYNEIWIYYNSLSHDVSWHWDYITQLFELTGSNVLGMFTYVGGNTWELTVGNKFYRIYNDGGSGSHFDKTYFYRKETGTTTRPSTYVSMQMTFNKIREYTNLGYQLYGGVPGGPYLFTSAVTHLDVFKTDIHIS